MYNNENVIKYYEKLLDTRSESLSVTASNILSARINKTNEWYRILDIGCGLSPLLPILKIKILENNPNSHIHYVGIDSSKEMIEKAKEYNKGDDHTTIRYINADIVDLYELKEFSWYNIVIMQSFVHLLLNDDYITKICKFISKILVNNGVFYISTKININKIKNANDNENDLHIVEKIEKLTYKRRIFTQESFEKTILRVFREENTYDINVNIQNDEDNNEYVIAIGTKNTQKLYDKYRYSFDFVPELIHFEKVLDKCIKVIEYVDNPVNMHIIRK